MPPERYQAWLDSLPEYDPEAPSALAVIVPPVAGYTGVIVRMIGPSKQFSRVRMLPDYISVRVNYRVQIVEQQGITDEAIKSAVAPTWSRTAPTDVTSLEVSQIVCKISETLPD